MDIFSYVVEFDFLGKDSIRYYNKVPVEKRVFKNLRLFMENKSGNDDLFDRLDVSFVEHIHFINTELVARTYFLFLRFIHVVRNSSSDCFGKVKHVSLSN